MREQIVALENQARKLDPTPDARAAARSAVVDYAERFLDRIDSINAYNRSDEKGAALLTSPIAEDGIDIDEALGLIAENVDTPGLNPASGGHLGYIPGGGIYYSALGDYLADVFNRYAGVFYASPGAVRMENMLIRWMADLVGYPATAGGNLTSGGSIANLIGIVTARDAQGVTSTEIPRSVIYLSEQAHHSIDKAIRIAGLAECVIRHLPLDEKYRIVPSALAEQIDADRAAGLRPFLVIASAGTTDVGAIDPLVEIGEIARAEGLWFHVDAAYGGYFVLTEDGKQKLRGMELSNSLVIDPHKGLFLPYGSGVVLVRDADKLGRSHYYTANYMQDASSSTDEPSPAELSPELTKHFRGLRLWLPLKLHGLAPFRACLEEKLLLARYFYDQVQKLGFECPLEPELSVVVYRYRPEHGDADEFNRRLLEEVVTDGRAFISSTVLDGKYTLRFACLAFRTHLKTVDTLLEILNNAVNKLNAEFDGHHHASA
ncbi:MAG: pyridoxal phosphate-dependent decarboxylase family protein [Pyrinomonadaceae bacterium]